MSKMIRLLNTYPVKVFVFALAYFISGRVSLQFAIPPAFAAPVWIAAGIALAGILLGGYRYLPGVFLGSTVVSIVISIDSSGAITTARPVLIAAMIGVAATAQAAISAYLIKRVVEFPCLLERERDIGMIMVLGGPIGCIVSATISCGVMLASGFISADAYLISWLIWWTGDVTGVILFAPLILILATSGINLSRRFTVTIPSLVLLAAIILAFSYTKRTEADAVKSEFKEKSLNELIDLERKIETYGEILRLSEGFYNASSFVDRKEFGLFTKNILQRHVEIQAIGWIPYIIPSKKVEFEQMAHKDGYKNFTITVQGQDDYFPLYYVEPYSVNEQILGLDLALNPSFLSAIRDARDSGKQIASKIWHSSLSGKKKDQLFIFNPVYEVGKPVDTITGRRENLKGFTVVILAVKELIESSISTSDDTIIKVYAYDNYIRGDDAILYGIQDKFAPFVNKLALEVAGRQWTFEFTPSDGFLNQRRWHAWNVIIGGLLFSSLLQAFLLIMTARTEIVRRMVRERTSELEDSETQHRAVVDNAAEGLITIDDKGIIKTFNPAAESIFGYKEAEVIEKNVSLLMPEPERSQHDGYLSAYQKTGKKNIIGQGREIVAMRKDGSVFPADLSVSEIKLSTHTFYSGIIRDITERKASEKQIENYMHELELAKEKAEEATRLKSEFLANMSHEIRTPMNGVVGMTNLLMDTELNSEQRNYAQTVLASADSLLEILNDILDLSKIEAGKLDIESIPFDLQALVEDSAEITSFKCLEKGLEVLVNYPVNVPRHVVGDPGRVRQIIINLLSNAIKFTEKGHVLLSVNSVPSSQNDKVAFRVEVQDTGIGIPEDKLDIIFNKFDQADQSTTRKFGGTGLGLAICRRLTGMMGGDTGVASKLGKGSTFWFTMELYPNTDEAIDLPSAKKTDLSGAKILVVDDNKVAVSLIKELLKAYNLQVDTANTVNEALVLVRQEAGKSKPYDFVLTDQHISGKSGEQLCKELKKDSDLKNITMVLSTSVPLKGNGKRIKAIGFDGYITKPIRPSELPQMLHILWEAKKENKTIPLVTHNTLKEVVAHSSQNTQLINANILLVEDNRVNMAVACAMLEGMGCLVTPAANGIEAVALFKSKKFDLIFMDCQMPEMDGYEATQAIRKIETENKLKPTAIIAFTANAMKEDKEKCLKYGMDGHIPKPVKPEMLEDVLKKWLPNAADV